MYYISGYYIFGREVATGNVITENVIIYSGLASVLNNEVQTVSVFLAYESIVSNHQIIRWEINVQQSSYMSNIHNNYIGQLSAANGRDSYPGPNIDPPPFYEPNFWLHMSYFMYYIIGYYIFYWEVATGNVITENVIKFFC